MNMRMAISDGTTSGFVELGTPIVFVEGRAKRGPTTIGGDKTHPKVAATANCSYNPTDIRERKHHQLCRGWPDPAEGGTAIWPTYALRASTPVS
jgi:hypothetical protein